VGVNAALCDRIRGYVSLELDDELSELEHTILEAHTADCRACGEYRAALAGYTAALREAPTAPVEHSFGLPGRPSRLRPLSTAAAAAVVLAAFVSVFSAPPGDTLRPSRGLTTLTQPRLTERNIPNVVARPDERQRGGASGIGQRIL
jgi:hypothetical protein